MTGGGLEVARAGALTTVQDGGRAGWAHLGVPRSGALDPAALVLANALVGNPEHAAGLETTLTGVAVRACEDVVVAVTGAPAPVTVDGAATAAGRPVRLGPGQVVDVGPATAGVRCYVAVSGGIAVPPVLGSRSTDTLSGLGPAPLVDGAVLPVGTPHRLAAPAGAPRRPVVPADVVTLRVSPGPREDWLTAAGRAALVGTRWTLSPESNRVGARLNGPALERAVTGELPSEGLVLGAVQVPAGGRPIVFLADHPTTGGYPVVAVVDAADLPLLAQARPGATVLLRAGPA